MNPIDITIIYILKFVALLSKFLKKGSGTAITGLFVENHYQKLISKLTKNYSNIVLISGTNGKTTIHRAIIHILKDQDKKITANTSGSNMLRGIASSLVRDYSLISNQNKENNYLILEVEEATLPRLTELLDSNYIILTNLFRDQLDAYGELTKTQQFLIQACKSNPNSTVIYNSSDPLVRYVADNIKNKKYKYNLGEITNNFINDFKYESKIVDTDILNEEKIHLINIFQKDKTQILVKYQNQALQFDSKLPGIYNVLNMMAALTFASLIELDMIDVIHRLEELEPPFGRGEILEFNDRKIQILLTKNPAGFEQVINYINARLNLDNSNNTVFSFLLNDNRADGRDVSWIWDINLETLKISDSKFNKYIFSGSRLYDAALRFKYAEYDESKFIYFDDISTFVDSVIHDRMYQNNNVIILATYTAMLELRKELSKFLKLKDIETI